MPDASTPLLFGLDAELLWFCARLGFGIGLLAGIAGLLAWGLLLQPVLAARHGAGFGLVHDAATWRSWLRVAAIAAAVVGALFCAFMCWYCQAMLRGSGKAEP